MKRALYVMVALMAGLMMVGCAGGRMNGLERSVLTLQDENKSMLAKVENLELKLADSDGRLKSAESQLGELKSERARLAAELELAKKSAHAKESAEASEGESEYASIRIKVVERGPKNAKVAMAAPAKLKRLGFKDVMVDKAGGKGIKKKTVFYRPDFKEQAQRVAKIFPGSELKPLAKKSSFDIIVAP